MGDLRFRYEIKYLLCLSDYIQLKQRLSNFSVIDENALSNGKYYVRSLYFDDIYDKAFNDKVIGIKNRYKYRIRTYNNDKGFIRLEKKIKKGNMIAKETSIITLDEYNSILYDDASLFEASDSIIRQDFYQKTKTDFLKPKIIIDYQRESYIWDIPNNKIRLTFDSDLQWATNSLDIFDKNIKLLGVEESCQYIFEIKCFDIVPRLLMDLINPIIKYKTGFSKYEICRRKKENMGCVIWTIQLHLKTF